MMETGSINRRSALYVGKVFHRRFRPREHQLSYRVFWLLLDLDELPRLSKRVRLWSLNRFNLFSFYDRDHGSGADEPIRAQIDRQLAAAGLDLEGGAIELFLYATNPGFAFNPLSVYFCHHYGGELRAILYEVHNTFGERHSYLIPVTAAETAHEPIRQHCDKSFYVSPFLDMAMTYDFTVTEPRDSISVSIVGSNEQGPMITASLAAARRDLSDPALLNVFFSHPLLTLKVIAGIHWEALKMLLKGLRLRARPAAPASSITIVRPEGA